METVRATGTGHGESAFQGSVGQRSGGARGGRGEGVSELTSQRVGCEGRRDGRTREINEPGKPGDVPTCNGTKDETVRMLRKQNSARRKNTHFSLRLASLPAGSGPQTAAVRHLPSACHSLGPRDVTRGSSPPAAFPQPASGCPPGVSVSWCKCLPSGSRVFGNK